MRGAFAVRRQQGRKATYHAPLTLPPLTPLRPPHAFLSHTPVHTSPHPSHPHPVRLLLRRRGRGYIPPARPLPPPHSRRPPHTHPPSRVAAGKPRRRGGCRRADAPRWSCSPPGGPCARHGRKNRTLPPGGGGEGIRRSLTGWGEGGGIMRSLGWGRGKGAGFSSPLHHPLLQPHSLVRPASPLLPPSLLAPSPCTPAHMTCRP